MTNPKPKSGDGGKWTCTTILTLFVAFCHLLTSFYFAFHSVDNVAIFVSITAIAVNILLFYGAIYSRKETLIAWLTFYGILTVIAMSCFTPKNIKNIKVSKSL